MKKGFFIPAAVLTCILLFSIWNSHAVEEKTSLWCTQLQQVSESARSESWETAVSLLTQCYTDWSAYQARLHIVASHSIIDDAKAMFHRAVAFASVQEQSEFQAEISNLIDQLQLLTEMERFTVGNIL